MRKEYLANLLDLTLKQTEALKADEIEVFKDLLEQKQDIFNQIDIIKQHESIEWTEEEKILIKQIEASDTWNRKEFDRQLEEVKSKLKQIRTNKAGNHVYNNPYDVHIEEGIFFDKRGR